MPEPRPAKHEDVAKEKVRDLSELERTLFSLKGAANSWPSGPEYAKGTREGVTRASASETIGWQSPRLARDGPRRLPLGPREF